MHALNTSRVLRARAQMEHRQKLRAGVDDEPEPRHVLATPEPRSQFIQLEMREPEGAERVLVQRLGMFLSASEIGSLS